MNITASYSSEPSWSRRCSTETIFSIQGKETDFVRDTSDTELGSDAEREFEPATESEDDGPIGCESSGQSDNEIITTKVIEVSVGDDGELQFADSEQTDSDGSDSEMDLYDYWLCAQCRAENNNPLYRYCEKCFKVRKNFFPPRPKRKSRRNNRLDTDLQTFSQESGISAKTVPDTDILPVKEHLPDSQSVPDTYPIQDTDTADPERFARTLSQDSGVESAFNSQESCQERVKSVPNVILGRRKRRADSVDRNNKRIRTDYTDSESDASVADVQPIVKMVSDPALTIDNNILPTDVLLKDKLEAKDDMCIVCFAEPKSGVFVHGRIAHICCCYKCAVKVWAKAKRCPVCNCKVSNVLKAVVM
ncbi:unnamed protein product [Colias eurytheme]|nr:unnamed protein product [Colias eurytheme]